MFSENLNKYKNKKRKARSKRGNYKKEIYKNNNL